MPVSFCSKTSLPYGVHFTTNYSVCQHPAQKKFLDFGQIDNRYHLEYNGSQKRRRFEWGNSTHIKMLFCIFLSNFSAYPQNLKKGLENEWKVCYNPIIP